MYFIYFIYYKKIDLKAEKFTHYGVIMIVMCIIKKEKRLMKSSTLKIHLYYKNKCRFYPS